MSVIPLSLLGKLGSYHANTADRQLLEETSDLDSWLSCIRSSLEHGVEFLMDAGKDF